MSANERRAAALALAVFSIALAARHGSAAPTNEPTASADGLARGVTASRITTISYGKDRPTALGDNEQAWAQNRNTITSVR